MREIHKRTWTPYFEEIIAGRKHSEIRLSDFDIEEGDVIIFEEWNPHTEYTGRSVSRVVDKLFKVNLTEFWTEEEIDKFGVYLIELSDGYGKDVKKLNSSKIDDMSSKYPIVCPKCRNRNDEVYDSELTTTYQLIEYHRCLKCGYRWKEFYRFDKWEEVKE